MLTCIMHASVCQGPQRYSEDACGQVRWPIKPISVSTDTQGCGAAAGVARAPRLVAAMGFFSCPLFLSLRSWFSC
jgi:hypothetical protein